METKIVAHLNADDLGHRITIDPQPVYDLPDSITGSLVAIHHSYDFESRGSEPRVLLEITAFGQVQKASIHANTEIRIGDPQTPVIASPGW